MLRCWLQLLKARWCINQLWKSVLIDVWMCLIIVKCLFFFLTFGFRYVLFHESWHWSQSSAVKMKLVVFLNMNVNFKCIWNDSSRREICNTIRKNSSAEGVAFFGENGKWVLICYLSVAHFLGHHGKQMWSLSIPLPQFGEERTQFAPFLYVK